MLDKTEEEKFDEFLEALDQIQSEAVRLFGNGDPITMQLAKDYRLAGERIAIHLEGMWATDEKTEYEQAHAAGLAADARAIGGAKCPK